MKLSFIIPAFNEQACIESCVLAIRDGMASPSLAHVESEIIVADNNSSDATAEAAARAGARVVFEPVNHIARARNTGAAAATGDWLVFVDADTLVTADSILEMLDLIATGRYCGGGTTLRYDRVPFFWKFFLTISNRVVIPLLRWTPGCFIFCRADAFKEIGGFNQQFYVGEDAEMGKAMKRWGRPHKLGVGFLRRHPPITSIRKVDLYGTPEVMLLILRWLFLTKRTQRTKEWLRVHYDGRR